jgi:hypothetical protein
MIENLQNWMMAFDFTSWMGFGLYWLPLSLCAYGYTVRTWLNYQKDVTTRAESENDLLVTETELGRRSAAFYNPTDTIGTLIGRGLAATIPVVNLWAACFDVAPRLFASMFKWFGRVFDQPLVPKRKVKSNRKSKNHDLQK